MRKFKYGCGVIAQNVLLNYSLFKITANPSKKAEFSSKKQKDMSDDGIYTLEITFSSTKIVEFSCLGRHMLTNGP